MTISTSSLEILVLLLLMFQSGKNRMSHSLVKFVMVISVVHSIGQFLKWLLHLVDKTLTCLFPLLNN